MVRPSAHISPAAPAPCPFPPRGFPGPVANRYRRLGLPIGRTANPAPTSSNTINPPR
jgi:hypothetical protein